MIMKVSKVGYKTLIGKQMRDTNKNHEERWVF